MPSFTRQPTANETPDSGQPGTVAVTGNVNTGHGSTLTSGALNTTQIKSCRWSALAAAPAGVQVSASLTFSWSEDGAVGDDASNQFRVQYSVNGGGAWSNALTHNDVIGPDSGSSSVSIPTPLDVTQFQVRDTLTASGSDIGIASLTVSISDITLTVTTQDAPPVMIT